MEKISKKQLLEEVQEAIRVVLAGGQQVTIGNRSVSRPTLSRLVDLQNELEAQLRAEDSGVLFDNTYACFFDTR